MQSLSFFKNAHFDLVVPSTLRGFPDINARSPNDPTYMFSSQDVFKLIAQFADVVDRSEIRAHHYVAIWAYAIQQGWKDVYMDGGQLFLVSGFEPRNPVVPNVITRRMIVGIDKAAHPKEANLLGYIGLYDPLINAVGTQATMTAVTYTGDDQRRPLCASDDTKSNTISTVLTNKAVIVAHLCSGGIHYHNVPNDCALQFEVEYQIQFD